MNSVMGIILASSPINWLRDRFQVNRVTATPVGAVITACAVLIAVMTKVVNSQVLGNRAVKHLVGEAVNIDPFSINPELGVSLGFERAGPRPTLVRLALCNLQPESRTCILPNALRGGESASPLVAHVVHYAPALRISITEIRAAFDRTVSIHAPQFSLIGLAAQALGKG